VHPTAARVYQYLNDYADEFNLRPYIKFGHTVTDIERDEILDAWTVNFLDDHHQECSDSFAKLVFATGTFQDAIMPTFSGRDEFTGTVVHSQNFKS